MAGGDGVHVQRLEQEALCVRVRVCACTSVRVYVRVSGMNNLCLHMHMLTQEAVEDGALGLGIGVDDAVTTFGPGHRVGQELGRGER